ncbi:Cytochrome P450 2D6 [Mactra antiquata]
MLDINDSSVIHKFEKMAKRSGEIFSVNICGQTIVFLNSEPLLRKAFGSEQYAICFNDRPTTAFRRLFRTAGESVASFPHANDIMFKIQKKALIKALHAYGSGIQKLKDKVLVELENVLKKIENNETKEFDCSAFLQRSLSNILSMVKKDYSDDNDGGIVQFYLEEQRKDCQAVVFHLLTK